MIFKSSVLGLPGSVHSNREVSRKKGVPPRLRRSLVTTLQPKVALQIAQIPVEIFYASLKISRIPVSEKRQ
jgi:hypothetical protein